MKAKRPVVSEAATPQKKKSIVVSNEDLYSLSLKILPSEWDKVSRSEQREIKNALRDIDDLIYTLLYSPDPLKADVPTEKASSKTQYIDGSPVAGFNPVTAEKA